MPVMNRSFAMDMAHLYAGERGLADLRLHLASNEDHFGVNLCSDTLYMRKERDLFEWEGTLSHSELALLAVTRNVYRHYPMEGGCYHLAFFLACYLKDRYGIDGQAVVGFVNDGTSDHYYSHAWYVLDGRITDIAISRPVDPEYHWRGPLTILGHEVAPGWQWSYHTESSKEGARILKEMPPYDRLPAHRKLHLKMSAISKSQQSMRLYLDNALTGYSYDEMAKRLDALALTGI